MLHGLTTKKNLTPLYFHWSLPHFKYLTVRDGLLASNIRGLIKANRNQAPMVRKYSNCVNMPRRLWGIPSSFCFKFLNSYHVSHFSFISFFMAAYFFVLCVSDKWVAYCEKKKQQNLLWNPTPFLTMNNSFPGLYHVHWRPRLHGCHKEGVKKPEG